MTSARLLAVRCLAAQEKGGYSNLIFKQQAGGAGLSERDTAFAAALFYGALERRATLDYILSPLLSRPIARLDAEVRCALRMGLYQCLYMDGVPVRAAVDESVALCGALGKTSAKGLVNAVLRRASEFDLSSLDALGTSVTGVAVRCSVCEPLAALLLSQYGGQTERMLEATFERRPAAARVNTLRTDTTALIAALAAENVPAQKTWLTDAVELGAGWLSSAAFLRGDLRVQSVAAQCAAAAVDPQPGERVLDMCAAPGGKTLTMAQRMQNRGRIVALDIHDSRLKLIDDAARKEGVSIAETRCADAADYADDAAFDRVLCDVPCSGYGELAAKPELRYKEPAQENTLVPLQRAILENGARKLRRGGRLVYATCTLDRRENEDVASAFLGENADFRAIDPPLPARAPRDAQGFVTFLPGVDDNEGFFIATFERI
ncbi:MAG: 16S rRNA (cytosine(967)-C(5))-methyltransferase RsmB [Oscillospiraceae bacterium]|nr:16S rRNA (cytosine(967)-C(5))-methyltransferase RsmB [Oscillospiraceae bacterium]